MPWRQATYFKDGDVRSNRPYTFGHTFIIIICSCRSPLGSALLLHNTYIVMCNFFLNSYNNRCTIHTFFFFKFWVFHHNILCIHEPFVSSTTIVLKNMSFYFKSYYYSTVSVYFHDTYLYNISIVVSIQVPTV